MLNLKEINIGLLGLGTVGSSVVKVLEARRSDLVRLGAPLTIKKVLVREPDKDRTVDIGSGQITTEAADILEDPDIHIIVELMGGHEPARTHILKALEMGKQVVTANKELMAKCGQELWQAAEEGSDDLYFEASVGGGIPIVRPLKELLVGNKILKIMGIVNGTTNFILTKMAEEKWSFDEALRRAQEEGYAESDPSADIEGRDAAAKIAILASIGFNSRVTVDEVYAEGVSTITPEDIAYAEELGYVVKLLAVAKEDEGQLEVKVHPTMIREDHPLATVNDVYNAIFVEGDAVGELMFFGQGAGGMATASAVVGDLVEVARNLAYGSTGKISCTCFEDKRVKPVEETKTCFYLLMDVADQPGVLANIAKAMGDNDVSLDKVIQKRAYPLAANADSPRAEVMFMTHSTMEKQLRAALDAIRGLSTVHRIINVIRVEDSSIGI